MGNMFPPDWEVSERIAVEFCDITRNDIEKLMFKRKHELDTKLLLFAIQKTVNFESLLSRRFTGITLEQHKQDLQEKKEKESKVDSTNPFEEPIEDESNPFYEDIKNEEPVTKGSVSTSPVPDLAPFHGLISQCFEAYLYIYIESQDKTLSDLIDRAAQEQREKGCTNLAVEGSSVLHSCGDLFMFYKKSIKQCAELSRAEPMLALQKIFKKHLKEYATKILIANMPGKASTSTSSSAAVGQYALTNLTKELKEVVLKDFSNPQGLIQNFFKEGDSKITPDERVFLCSVIVTSEYIIETTEQLELKLKEKVDPDFVNRISFNGEQNIYIGVITSCVQLLVQELENACEPHLSQMVKMTWYNVESVGDQSPYVSALINVAKQMIPVVRDNLASSRKHFTQFCVKFANNFIPKFLQHLYKCKPLSTVGAEQLLLDTHSIKTLLLDLPSIGSKVATRKAPASYTKIVVKGMTRAEMTLKVVMSLSDPIKPFVEQYVKLVSDADLNEFQNVLEMKGIKKVDQYQYVDIFKTISPNTQLKKSTKDFISTDSPLSPSSAGVANIQGTEESRIKKLERLIKTFK